MSHLGWGDNIIESTWEEGAHDWLECHHCQSDWLHSAMAAGEGATSVSAPWTLTMLMWTRTPLTPLTPLTLLTLRRPGPTGRTGQSWRGTRWNLTDLMDAPGESHCVKSTRIGEFAGKSGVFTNRDGLWWVWTSEAGQRNLLQNMREHETLLFHKFCVT